MQFSALVADYGGGYLSPVLVRKNFIENKEPTALTKESKWIHKSINGEDQKTRLLIQAIKNSLNFIKRKNSQISCAHPHTAQAVASMSLYADCKQPPGSAHICEDHLH